MAREITIAEGRTTIVPVPLPTRRPWEQQPEFLAMAPTFRRAVDMDAEQRWADATGLYQQALGELGTGARLASNPLLEQAAHKIEQERRRSRVLAQAGLGGADDKRRTRARGAPAAIQLTPLEHGRLLRLKLMAVRAATGSAPPRLASATVGALLRALRASVSRADAHAPDSRSHDGAPEIRMLLCATRAASGDRAGARLEWARVAQADRLNPTHAVAAAACQAALGRNDDALGSLGVAAFRLGPSTRLLPGQSRELREANDWDALRTDPRFDRLFR